MPASLHIDLVNRQHEFRIDRRRLLAATRTVLRAEGVRTADVEVAIVDDAEIARLNWQYLKHRGATDVLSFDLGIAGFQPASGSRSSGLTTRTTCVGQVIVSADTARRQAREIGHPIIGELTLYVIHGLLHLLGYDDLTEPARRRMHRRQRELAERLGCRLRG